jgi:hypothetical protein
LPKIAICRKVKYRLSQKTQITRKKTRAFVGVERRASAFDHQQSCATPPPVRVRLDVFYAVIGEQRGKIQALKETQITRKKTRALLVLSAGPARLVTDKALHQRRRRFA